MKEQRIVYFDYLRIIAIFAVVVLHFAAQNWDGVNVSSFEWQIFNLYDATAAWGVPVFVMISGALFLGKELTLKKLYGKYILRIVTVFIFWSVIYALWNNFVFRQDYNLGELAKEIVLGHYHLWFLYMIAGLYIVVPFLSKIVADKKTARYFVVASFIFACLIPQCTDIIGLKFEGFANIVYELSVKMRLHLVLGFSGCFVLGHLLNQLELKKKHRIIIYILGVLGLIITIVATSVVSLCLQTPIKMFYGFLTVNVLFSAAAVFVFAKTHLNRPPVSERRHDLLLLFSKCSFGVYLIHPFIIEFLKKFSNLSSLSFNPIISVPILAFFIFMMAMLIAVILNKIPKVKKWIV